MTQNNDRMVSVIISQEWYWAVMPYVKTDNVRFSDGMVEVDVEADTFIKESIALGWM